MIYVTAAIVHWVKHTHLELPVTACIPRHVMTMCARHARNLHAKNKLLASGRTDVAGYSAI